MINEIIVWLRTLILCGCITSVILFIMPNNRCRGFAELGCSVLMILVLVSPIMKINIEDYAAALSAFNMKITEEMNDTQEMSKEFHIGFIEEEYKEYILNEAEVQGIKLNTVSVEVVEAKAYCFTPFRVIYYCDSTIPESFMYYIETQLGVPIERQIVYEVSGSNS